MSYDPEQLRFFPSVFRTTRLRDRLHWQMASRRGCWPRPRLGLLGDLGPGRRSKECHGLLQQHTRPDQWGAREPLGGYSTDRYTELAVDYIKEKEGGDKPWYLWLCYGGVHGPYTPADRHKTTYDEAPAAKVPSDIFGPRPTKPEHMKNMTRWKKDQDGNPKGYDGAVKKYHKAVKSSG